MRSLFLIGILLLVAGSVRAQAIERTFAARDGGSIVLHLEAGGDLEITGGASAVEVHVTREGRDAERVEVEFVEANGRIEVSSRRNGNNLDVDVRYAVSVPARFNVEARTMGGDLTASGVTGSLALETMGGDVRLSRLGGTLDARTMGGDISLAASNVDGSAETLGGDIELSDVSGDMDAKTMGGDITYSNVRPAGKRALKVETMGGDIEVGDAPGGIDAKTTGGDIEIGDVAGHARVETMGGDIEVGSVAGWLEGTTMGGNIEASIVGTDGDRHVELSSMGGDIELTLPAGFSGQFELEVTRQGRGGSGDDVGIESDFALQQSTEGSDRDRTLKATGSTGDGRHVVRLTTTNGRIAVKRAN